MYSTLIFFFLIIAYIKLFFFTTSYKFYEKKAKDWKWKKNNCRIIKHSLVLIKCLSSYLKYCRFYSYLSHSADYCCAHFYLDGNICKGGCTNNVNLFVYKFWTEQWNLFKQEHMLTNCDAFSSMPSWIRGVQLFRSVCSTLFWIFVKSNMTLLTMSSYSRLCQRYIKHYILL